MKDVLGHVGRLGPPPEQVAVAHYLDDVAGDDPFLGEMRRG